MDATAASRPAPLLGPSDVADDFAAPSTAIYDKQLAWKLHGQRKLNHAADALRSREEEHCTFSPKTNRRSPQKAPPSLVLSPRSDRSSASVGGCSAESPRSSPCSPRPSTVDSCSASAGAVLPTDAQESSILLHFARQERARGFVHVAQQKLASTMPGKDFSKTTKPAPFALSASNWKPRQSTPTDGGKAISPGRVAATAPALPSDQQQQADSADGGVSALPSPPPPAAVQPASKARTKPSSGAKHSNNHSRPASTRSVTADDAWETERATLVAVLDAQRRELALRARAQADAVRAAESFASATQRFEERLAALESRTADELREIRRLLARQAAASDLILRSLGLALPPEPPSAAAEGGKAL